MAASTILIYGSPEHPSLRLIYQHLMQRARREVVYLIQETYPTRVALFHKVGEPGSMFLPEDLDAIELDDLVSICMDGYYISPNDLGQGNLRDLQYVQAESWAALIALFHQAAEKALVANHVLLRDYLTSRWSELCLLARSGLRVPKTLVTSNPARARKFYDEHQGKILFKALSSVAFQELGPEERERLDQVAVSPWHLEEQPADLPTCSVVVVGSRFIVPGGQATVPQDVLDKCSGLAARLSLALAEFPMRLSPDGWVVSGIRRFPSPEVLQDAEVIDAVVNFLEKGKQS